MARLVPSSGVATYNGPAGRELSIIAELPTHNPGMGTPAVLTDGTDWYSADIVFDGKSGRFIAYAVNGYTYRAEAERNAESRADR